MPRTDADKQTIINELEAEAVELREGRYVRQCDAIRIIGISLRTAKYWQQRGHVTPKRVDIKKRVYWCDRGRWQRGMAPNGIVTLWPLKQIIARVRKLRQLHRWTHADDDYLLENFGRESVSDIAVKIGCTKMAVHRRAYEVLGINARSNAGLLTTGEAARILRTSRTTVHHWCHKRGLPSLRIHRSNFSYLIDPKTLRNWLNNQPLIKANRDPRGLERLERMALTSTQRYRRVA